MCLASLMHVVLCREQHRDVLASIVFLNSYHDILYKYAYGDKDLFEMAFLLAGKADYFYRAPNLPRIPMMDSWLLASPTSSACLFQPLQFASA